MLGALKNPTPASKKRRRAARLPAHTAKSLSSAPVPGKSPELEHFPKQAHILSVISYTLPFYDQHRCRRSQIRAAARVDPCARGTPATPHCSQRGRRADLGKGERKGNLQFDQAPPKSVKKDPSLSHLLFIQCLTGPLLLKNNWGERRYERDTVRSSTVGNSALQPQPRNLS